MTSAKEKETLILYIHEEEKEKLMLTPKNHVVIKWTIKICILISRFGHYILDNPAFSVTEQPNDEDKQDSSLIVIDTFSKWLM